MANHPKDLTDQIFTRLKALHRDGDKLDGRSVVWVCQCECNNIISVPARDLVSGNTRSCGCLSSDHGKSLATYNAENHYVGGAFVPLLKQKVQHNSTTGVKGVSVQRLKDGRERYMANITIKGKRHYLGVFDVKDDAILARQKAEEEYYKPYLEDNSNG